MLENNLIVGEVYIGTLNNEYFRNEKVVLKYIGKNDMWDGYIQFEVMEDKHWPKALRADVYPKEVIWKKRRLIDLSEGAYTFELYNIVLENE